MEECLTKHGNHCAPVWSLTLGLETHLYQLLTKCLDLLEEWISFQALPSSSKHLNLITFLSFFFQFLSSVWISLYSHGQKLINLLHLILLFSFIVKSSALVIILQNSTTWRSQANLLTLFPFSCGVNNFEKEMSKHSQNQFVQSIGKKKKGVWFEYLFFVLFFVPLIILIYFNI